MSSKAKLPKPLLINTVKELALRLHTTEEHLYYLEKHAESFYYKMEKINSSGKVRTLFPPKAKYKDFLRKVNAILMTHPLPEYFHGGIKGKSSRTNAQNHLSKEFVQPLDLQDFFHSIRSGVSGSRPFSQPSPPAARTARRGQDPCARVAKNNIEWSRTGRPVA